MDHNELTRLSSHPASCLTMTLALVQVVQQSMRDYAQQVCVNRSQRLPQGRNLSLS